MEAGSGDSFDVGGSGKRRGSCCNGGNNDGSKSNGALASLADDDEEEDGNIYGIALAPADASGGNGGDGDDPKTFRRFCRGSLKRLRRAESKVSVAKRDMEEILAQAKVSFHIFIVLESHDMRNADRSVK